MDSFDERNLDKINACSLVREDRILGNTHLNVATKYARENYERGRMISRSLWNEILLYLSMQRQVYKAFEMVGVKNYSGKVIKIEFSEEPRDEPKISVAPSKKGYWGVSTIEELLEKMALFHLENY